jgi:hypothetical protein
MTPIQSAMQLGIVRGISYGLFGKPDAFVASSRTLGAGLVRAYLYWSQVEPHQGCYSWATVDALLDQLDGDEEVWLTVCSSSPWATRQPTDFLPPSTRLLAGAESVAPVDCAEQPTVLAFRVNRTHEEPLIVLWERRDAFDGECDPPISVALPWALPWATPNAHIVDAFGNTRRADVRSGVLQLDVNDTPQFLDAS